MEQNESNPGQPTPPTHKANDSANQKATIVTSKEYAGVSSGGNNSVPANISTTSTQQGKEKKSSKSRTFLYKKE